jgi:hypothetical protein
MFPKSYLRHYRSLTVKQGRQTWPSCPSQAFRSTFETPYTVAGRGHYNALAVHSPQLREDCWTREPRASRKPVQSRVLPCNMGHNGVGRGILDSHEDSAEMAEGPGILCLLGLLPDCRRTGRREGAKGSGHFDSGPFESSVE